MRKKILSTFLIIFFTVIIFNINSVFGVGIVSQCWVNDVDGDGKQDLIFRTYTGPHISTVRNYHNTNASELVEGGIWNYKYSGTTAKAKWIYTYASKGAEKAAIDTFKTIGFAFHTEPMSNYPAGDKIGYTHNTSPLAYQMSTMAEAINNAATIKATPTVNEAYSNTVFYEVMRTNGTLKTMSWGTGLKISGLYAVGQTQYRYTIIRFGDGNKATDMYVADNVIYSNDVAELVKKSKELGKTEGCFVSNILISKAYGNNDDYEVSRTAVDFLKQHDKHWSSASLGKVDKSFESAINLYDNELIFPQLSKRTVLVRHINIGNNTTISASIVNNGSRIASTNLSLIAGNPSATIWGTNSSVNYSGYEEYYEGLLDIEQSITKNALPNTDKYKCIGYNIGVSNEESTALANVQARINSSQYTSGTQAFVPSKSVSDDSDFVVIDFYYSTYDKDVVVNHLYVDKDGKVLELAKQNIKPNDTAIMNSTTINRINQDMYISEQYRKELGYNIKVRIADVLKENIDAKDNLQYRGYEVFTTKTSASELVGTQRLNLNSGKEAMLTSTNIQVNFYYYLNNEKEEQEPKKDIAGTVFVAATGENVVSGTCNDTDENIRITSIPSGSQAKVGIKDIPRYMVGAITTEYVSPVKQEHTINLTLNFKLGEETKTVKYTDLKYRVGYYKVTDMAVYKLTNTTIYDANKGYDGTTGDSLFNWSDGKLNITPKNMNLKVQLTGINGKSIANNESSINNINNYVAINIEDKHGNKSTTGTATSSLTREYLTTDQIKEVDANKDNVINSNDKTFSDSELTRYNNILLDKQNIQANKQTDLNNAQKHQADLKDALDKAQVELDSRLKTYNEATSTKSSKLIAKTNAENDLAQLRQELEERKAELAELERQEAARLQEKEQAETNNKNAQAELERLSDIYLNSISERDTLASKVAYCEDYVEKEVEIYTEEQIQIYFEKDKLEELEQCKTYKQQYREHIENRVVELAQQAYEEYRDNEYSNSTTGLEDATVAYNNAVKATGEKRAQVTKLELTDIPAKQVIVQTISTDFTNYVQDVYRPAREAYEHYRDNEYKQATDAYETYVKENHISNAEQALNQAKQETQAAQSDYDTYHKYRENLYKKYDSYKAAYDEFQSITGSNENIAKALGLKINIFVQNMSVKVNGTELAKTTSNTVSYTNDLATYMTSKEVPQIRTEIPVISKEVYSNIGSTILKASDYTNVNTIEKSVLNGVRVLAGKADYEAQVAIGSKKDVKDIKDTVYYSDQSNQESTVIFRLKNTTLSRTYKVDNSIDTITPEAKYKSVEPINIYTPITVTATMESNSNQIVDQTEDTTFDTSMIQINTPFTINLANDEKPNAYKIDSTEKYSLGYYVKFEFDVHKVYVNGKVYNRGNRIPAGTWIGIITKNKKNQAYLTAQAYGNVDDDTIDIVSEEKSSYTVRAVAYNATSSMLERSTKYSVISNMIKETSDLKDILKNICKNPSYFAEKEYGVVIINRAYDFRVTDVKDLSWKSVFRKSTSNSTNAHTGNLYYAGTMKWNSKSEKTNSIISRTSAEIGRNPLRILPVGPYKSTNTTYIKSPKIGYRFSFDMKVTGSYYDSKGTPREDKKVVIATKFYYIDKFGNTYLEEYDGTKEGIYLFYKKSSGKYVKIDENGGGYELTFTPNDGYRYIQDSATSTLSKTPVGLGNLRHLTLTKDMATVSNNGSSITYYGEYKLPNSTIAVKVNKDGSYDINTPLKNGYVGVVFDIVAYSGTVNIDKLTQNVLLSYSKNTKDNQPNTSQWDYEGFLGYTEYGNKVKDGTLKMKLEKGTWNITDDIYNSIKGSVMLYDLDEKAATDYE